LEGTRAASPPPARSVQPTDFFIFSLSDHPERAPSAIVAFNHRAGVCVVATLWVHGGVKR